jgi:hypothetical protein
MRPVGKPHGEFDINDCADLLAELERLPECDDSAFCAVCGEWINDLHHPECTRRTHDASYVVSADCVDAGA